MVIADKNDVGSRDLFMKLVLRKDGIVFPERLGEFAKVTAAASGILRADIVTNSRQGMHLGRRSSRLLT
jgi:hypothetical protein